MLSGSTLSFNRLSGDLVAIRWRSAISNRVLLLRFEIVAIAILCFGHLRQQRYHRSNAVKMLLQRGSVLRVTSATVSHNLIVGARARGVARHDLVSLLIAFLPGLFES